MKDLTTKEFKQILNDNGVDFEVFKWEGILNMIIGHHNHLAETSKQLGSNTIAVYERQIADRLYNVLKARGYYDN